MKSSAVPESSSRRGLRPAGWLELDTDPPGACSALAERILSGTGPAMAICEAANIIRKALIRVVDEKGIIA